MRFIASLLTLLLLSPFGRTGAQAADPLPVVPFAPAELIQVLPQATDDWTLTRSDAQTTFGNWLQTRATRTFQVIAKSADASPKGEIEISVIDTGNYQPSLAPFSNLRPEKFGNIEHLLIARYPAIQISDPDGFILTQVLLASRYIVEVKNTGLPAEKVEAWLRRLHFDALPQKTSLTAGTLPRDLRLASIDELHPERNRSYSVSASRP